mgnify:FL=1
MNHLKKYALLLSVAGMFQPLLSMAAGTGCDAYPYSDGINVEDVKGGTKIVATASSSVSFDDIDSIKDAKDEALLEAKAAISKFLTEDIKSDEKVSRVINETKSMSGQSKQALRTEVKNRVKTLSNSSQALLRGVVPLGDCYTKGREVRVTVGIKPETIASAGNLAGGISKSVSEQPTATSTKPAATSANKPKSNANVKPGTQKDLGDLQPLQDMDSYSNSKRLDNF